jgi:hypothetical protein
MADCATPSGFAGHTGATASSQLTFHLDHSMQAGQIAKDLWEQTHARVEHVDQLNQEKLNSVKRNKE